MKEIDIWTYGPVCIDPPIQITELPLSNRLRKIFIRCGMKSTDDFKDMDLSDFLKIKCFGRKAQIEFLEFLYHFDHSKNL